MMKWLKKNVFLVGLTILIIILVLIAFQRWSELKESDIRKNELLLQHEKFLRESIYKIGLIEGILITYQIKLNEYEGKKTQVKNNVTLLKKKFEALPPTEQDKFFLEKFGLIPTDEK